MKHLLAAFLCLLSFTFMQVTIKIYDKFEKILSIETIAKNIGFLSTTDAP